VTNTRAGTVKPAERGQARAAGRAARSPGLPVKKGDHVESGQVLLELWNDEHSCGTDGHRARRGRARARREEACVAARVARRESDRLAQLVERKLVSTELAERAAGQADAQEAGCRAAWRTGARQPGTASTPPGEARAHPAARRRSTGRWRRSTAKSASSSPRRRWHPTPPAVDVVDTSCLYITAPIDEVGRAAGARGHACARQLDAFRDRNFPAHVRRVAPYVLDAEKQARTVEVEAEIDDFGDALLLRATARTSR